MLLVMFLESLRLESPTIGRDARLTVTGIGHTNELILDNVQGNFVVGGGKSMNYFNSVGVAQTLNNDLPGAPGGDVEIASIVTINDGLHMNISHQNHGMYFTNNSVILFWSKTRYQTNHSYCGISSRFY